MIEVDIKIFITDFVVIILLTGDIMILIIVMQEEDNMLYEHVLINR